MSPEPPTRCRSFLSQLGAGAKGCTTGPARGTGARELCCLSGAGAHGTLWWQSLATRCHCRNTRTTPAAAEPTLYRRCQGQLQSWEHCPASLGRARGVRPTTSMLAGPAPAPLGPLAPPVQCKSRLNKLNALIFHIPNPGLGQEEASVQREGHDVAGDLAVVLF